MDNQAERVVKALEGIKKAIYFLAAMVAFFIMPLISMIMVMLKTWTLH